MTELCRLCGKPVEAGVPVHGATGNHWECQEKLRENFERLIARPEPSIEECDPASPPYPVRANGGFLIHRKRAGTDTALCGKTPKNSPGARMKPRGYWLKVSDAPPAGTRRKYCEECDAEYEREKT